MPSWYDMCSRKRKNIFSFPKNIPVLRCLCINSGDTDSTTIFIYKIKLILIMRQGIKSTLAAIISASTIYTIQSKKLPFKQIQNSEKQGNETHNSYAYKNYLRQNSDQLALK
ncbi:MAG: phage terminase large subunit-like protein [Patescibacteria group bacterium]|jgi:phage terminase large subunit-like protein